MAQVSRNRWSSNEAGYRRNDFARNTSCEVDTFRTNPIDEGKGLAGGLGGMALKEWVGEDPGNGVDMGYT